MRGISRLWLATGLALLSASAVLTWRIRDRGWDRGADPTTQRGSKAAQGSTTPPAARAEAAEVNRFPDPNDPEGARRVFAGPTLLDQELATVAYSFTGPLLDDRDLAERCRAIASRTELGVARLLDESAGLRLNAPLSFHQANAAISTWESLGYLNMYEGRLDEAHGWLERALQAARTPGVSADDRLRLLAVLGILELRCGELENCVACVGPSSCIYPIGPDAVHARASGSRAAIDRFLDYLAERPGDLQVRWLLNLAYMTLGEHPSLVPPEFLISIDRHQTSENIGTFSNIASSVGLDARGPGLAGGCVFDDFNGDGLPDLLLTSIDPDRGASLFINKGDGTFEDQSARAGLDNQAFALNVTRTDYDNDGHLDVLLLRGGWESPSRLSLLRNQGDGTFEDVTIAAGLDEPIACESAAWGDFDNDGWLDVFVCGEYRPNSADTRNLCRLYRNQGNGTFVDVGREAGVLNDRYAKGAVWGDFDNDGWLDLFVANMSVEGPMPSRLYRNHRDGTFRDVAAQLGITGGHHHFACMFLDYDNDGWLDLLVSNYRPSLGEVIAADLGLPVTPPRHPFLYRNLQGQRFENVSAAVGLDRPIPCMSLNAADLDNDGWLDLHLGTGWMSYSGLYPNLTFRNVDGRRFADITVSSGTGHLQKGHGVSFADWNCDGALDLVLVLGGGFPGDKGFNALFQNPGQSRNWLEIKLVGSSSNRAAIGARIRADLKQRDGRMRSIHRTIGNNGSFGGNSLVEHIGLDSLEQIDTLTVSWPTSGIVQTFHKIPAGLRIEINEGEHRYVSVKEKPFQPPGPDQPASRLTR